GSDIAPPEVKAKIGQYKVLGKQVAQMIPGARLVEFKGMGHAPQMEEPAGFNTSLVSELK
ncbi:alpha/beta fold hydrolase, partial [Pseudomonas avellanae]